MESKRKLAATRQSDRRGLEQRIHGLAHSGPNPEYPITATTFVKPGADGGIRICTGKTALALNPFETAALIRVARRLTQPYTPTPKATA